MFLPFVLFFVFLLIAILVVASVLFSLTRPGAPLEQMLKGGLVSFGGYERDFIDIDGRKVFTSYSPGTNKHPSKMTISYKGGFFAHAVFRREKPLDRFGKSVGLNTEVQLNDKLLDSMVYIECEDELFVSRLLGSDKTKEYMENILKVVDDLTINGNSFTMTKTPCEDAGYFRSDLVRQAAASMLGLADNIPLPEPGQKSSTPLTEMNVRDTGMVTLFAGLILCAGIVLVIWGFTSYAPLFPGKLFQQIVPCLIPAASVIAFFFFYSVRGCSTGLKSFSVLLFLGMIGLVLSCFGGAIVFNGAKDASRQVQHDVFVIEKYTTRSKNTTTYHIKLSSWREDLAYYGFTVPCGTYNSMDLGDPCVVTTKSGALGVPWVAGRSCTSFRFRKR